MSTSFELPIHDQIRRQANALERKMMLTYSTAGRRRAVRRGAFTLGAAVIASLALAATAGAATPCPVITINPDGTTGSDHLRAAIAQANTDTCTAGDTIVMNAGRYTPAISSALPAITKNLTITANHAGQATVGTPTVKIDAGSQTAGAGGNMDLFTVNPNVSLTLEGVQITSGGGSGYADIQDGGFLTLWGVTISGDLGNAINVNRSAAVAALNESSIVSSSDVAIQNSGTVTLNNADILAGSSTGIVNSGGGFSLNNSILANNSGGNCGSLPGGATSSVADDSSCGSTGVTQDSSFDSQNMIPKANGGPTLTVKLTASSIQGQGTNCPTVDQRFFVNPGTTCDIGALTSNTASPATRETTGPTCTAHAPDYSTTPASMKVDVSDPGSGMGPMPAGGMGTDNPSDTPASTRPTSAVTVFGYPIDNVFIDNGGSVTFTPFSAPSRSTMPVTATKSGNNNTTNDTHWNFTATNWAGVSTFCN